jgi:DNA-binding PadR family transcriptional regulator
VLDFAILGLLHEGPMHGYELKKRLNAALGAFRAFSYGSLYPTLNRMQVRGWITVDDSAAASLLGARRRVTYSLTTAGKQRFAELADDAGPRSWDDDGFGVRLAFFSRTSPEARLRILEGRRSRLEERREDLRAVLTRSRTKVDSYTAELQRHGLENVDRDVHWLDGLILAERGRVSERSTAPPGTESLPRSTESPPQSGTPLPASPDRRPDAVS